MDTRSARTIPIFNTSQCFPENELPTCSDVIRNLWFKRQLGLKRCKFDPSVTLLATEVAEGYL